MTFTTAALTDIGRVRQRNEDRFLRDDALRLYAVADGIGGLPGGAEAAKLTVTALQRRVSAARPTSAAAFVKVILAVHYEVAALGRDLSPGLGIGTTLTCGLIDGTSLLLAHVGDSRAYLLAAGQLTCLTEDHTVKNEARLRRARGEHVHVPLDQRQALTRCIGQPGEPEVDVTTHELQSGDRLFLATDGIARVLPDEILATVIAPPTAPQACLDEAVRLTNDVGGPDNATAVLIACA